MWAQPRAVAWARAVMPRATCNLSFNREKGRIKAWRITVSSPGEV